MCKGDRKPNKCSALFAGWQYILMLCSYVIGTSPKSMVTLESEDMRLRGWLSISVQSTDIGIGILCCKPRFSIFVPWQNYLISLSSNFFICKTEMITALQGCWENEMRYSGKVLCRYSVSISSYYMVPRIPSSSVGGKQSYHQVNCVLNSTIYPFTPGLKPYSLLISSASSKWQSHTCWLDGLLQIISSELYSATKPNCSKVFNFGNFGKDSLHWTRPLHFLG